MRLTLEELIEMRSLWQLAWGTRNKTWEKLDKAVKKKEAKL